MKQEHAEVQERVQANVLQEKSNRLESDPANTSINEEVEEIDNSLSETGNKLRNDIKWFSSETRLIQF